MSVVGQTPCGPSVCYDVDGPLVFILGRCHRSHAPPWHTAHPGFEYFFFYRCGFPFCTEPFAPCPVMLLWFAFQDTVPFLPFKHDPVTQFCQLQKGARLILKALCSNSSKKKIVMVVTYVFQTSGLKAKKKKKKIYSVSSHVFWSEAWQSKTEIWTMRLLHGDMCLRQP